ncbi:MAG: tetratricopeptide repeat-containing glycosyltransferase family protein [Magnetococcus sp. DMHC-1]
MKKSRHKDGRFAKIKALFSAGQVTEAWHMAREALRHDAHNAALLNLAAVCAAQLGQPAQAEAYWRRVLVEAPDFVDVYNNLGILLHEQQRLSEAETLFRTALHLHPGYAEAHLNLGNLLHACKRFVEAEDAYRETLRLRPDLVQAHNNLGSLLHGAGRLAEAEACFQEALRQQPACVETHNNYGNLLDKLQRHVEAEAHFRLALHLAPQQVVGHLNLGNLLDKLGRLDEAISAYLAVLRQRPHDADALFYLSLTLLAQGRFREGWPLYEYRYHIGKKEPILMLPALPFPQWQGENLAGKSLLVWPEQGYGDMIQFGRFLPILKELGVRNITLVCKKPLQALFGGLPGVDQVLVEAPLAGMVIPHHDAWTLLLSIPLHLGIVLENIPDRLPYLHPLPERIAAWASRIPPGKCRVGLVWRGNPGHLNDACRSLPGLDILAPLWSVAGVVFIGLQHPSGAGSPLIPPPGQPLLNLGSEVTDFADTAAIIAQLDLVIGVDTAVMHLAGALGKPCWVLLPSIGIDWRWLEHRPDSPWYPGIMRLFRQKENQDWTTVVQDVRLALQDFVNHGCSRG